MVNPSLLILNQTMIWFISSNFSRSPSSFIVRIIVPWNLFLPVYCITVNSIQNQL